MTNTKIPMSNKREKYTAEFQLRSSPDLLYNYLATASGLTAWFADDVTVNGDVYTFMWDGSPERAQMIRKKPGKLVKFQWLDRDAEEYLTFEIELDELTRDVALMVTDFENEDEIQEAKMVWQVSIDQLKSTIGG
ncbi:MAG: START-like domain-containing protein [Bacteroidia bacterium]